MKIEASHLSKSFPSPNGPSIEVIKDASFELETGETMSLAGPSGSGKSTLTHLITGLVSPDSGEIRMGSLVLNQLTEDELNQFRADSIGIIFQQFHLIPHLTALENVLLPLELRGQGDSTSLAKEALESVQLSHRLTHFPHQMSRGECQRVAIARVLALKPLLVVADEPTGSLDQKTASEIMKLIFQLFKDQETSLILVSHDPKWTSLCEKRFEVKEQTLVEAP